MSGGCRFSVALGTQIWYICLRIQSVTERERKSPCELQSVVSDTRPIHFHLSQQLLITSKMVVTSVGTRSSARSEVPERLRVVSSMSWNNSICSPSRYCGRLRHRQARYHTPLMRHLRQNFSRFCRMLETLTASSSTYTVPW